MSPPAKKMKGLLAISGVEDNLEASRRTRKFSTYSLCVYGILASGCWTYAAVTFGTGFYAGGSPVLIYGAIGVNILWSIFLISIAEFASAIPSGAGIPVYSRVLAGPKWGPFCEYLTGFLHAFAVLFTTAGALIGMVQLFATCGALTHSDWVPQRWQLVVGYEGANIFMLLFILCGNKKLAFLNKIAIIGVIAGLFIIVGCLAGGSGPKASNRDVWVTVLNATGFESDSLCVLIGIVTVFYGYGIPHWLVNMADVVENPARTIPIALATQQIGNGITLTVFLIAAGYAVSDYDAVFTTFYPSAIGAVFDQAVQSKGGAVAMILIICVPGIISLMSYFNACMYVFHGFVRSGAIPGCQWLGRLSGTSQDPRNILYVLTAVNAILGLIYLVSPIGFSILLSAPGALYFPGYLVPLVAHVFTGGRNLTSRRWFKLSRPISVALSFVNIFLVTFTIILVCLPREGPTNAENMNYSVLFLGAGLTGAIITWNLYGKKHYREIDIGTFVGMAPGEMGCNDTATAVSVQEPERLYDGKAQASVGSSETKLHLDSMLGEKKESIHCS